MRDLFHGTTYDFNKIDVMMGKGYKDFGKEFYATPIKSHAENIARRNKRRKQRGLHNAVLFVLLYFYAFCQFSCEVFLSPDGHFDLIFARCTINGFLVVCTFF